jgi:hypothetical protein
VIFGVLAAAGLATAVVLLVRMHLVPTGLRPVPDAVSDYGTTAYHRNYRAMVIALGASAILLAVGLARETDAVDLFWLYVYGASRIAIAGFMTDRDPKRISPEGRVHWLLAAIAFTAIAFAASNIEWAGDPSLLGPLGYAVAATAIATLLARAVPALRGTFGLVERLLYVTSIAWLLAAAIDLIAGR